MTKTIDTFLRRIAPKATVVIRAEMLGMSEIAFHSLARELIADGGIDDFDLVSVHRVGETNFGTIDGSPPPALIDAVTLRRRKR